MIWGGPEEISVALLQEKINLERPSQKAFRGKNKSIFVFSSGPPQIINGRPLMHLLSVCGFEGHNFMT